MAKKSALSKAFKSVAAMSASAMLAASLMVGVPSDTVAQTPPEQPQNAAHIYKHATLASESTEPVGIHLVLAMDTSGSMSNEEFAIELQATATALNSEVVRNAIKYKSGDKSVAVAVLDFDGNAQVRVPWVDIRAEEINDRPYLPGQRKSSTAPDKLDMLAHEIRNLPRRGTGGTFLNEAMDLGKKLFLACPWGVTERRVLDVFGDGPSMPWLMDRPREDLASLGVTINAFAIVNEEPDVEKFFYDFLVTREFRLGPDGIYSEPGRIWAVARNLQEKGNTQPGLKSFFGEVTRGMRQKISVEIAGTSDYSKTIERLGLKQENSVPNPVR